MTKVALEGHRRTQDLPTQFVPQRASFLDGVDDTHRFSPKKHPLRRVYGGFHGDAVRALDHDLRGSDRRHRDLFSRRMSVCIGWFVVGIAFFIQGMFPVAAVVIAAQIILGIGDTFVSGAHDAWVADELKFSEPDMSAGQAFFLGQRASFWGRLCLDQVVRRGNWILCRFALDPKNDRPAVNHLDKPVRSGENPRNGFVILRPISQLGRNRRWTDCRRNWTEGVGDDGGGHGGDAALSYFASPVSGAES